MQRPAIERYIREVPFLALPFLLILAALLVTTEFTIPRWKELQEVRDKSERLPELAAVKKELTQQLDSLSLIFPEKPEYNSLSFTDGASLIGELLSIARISGITLNKTHPSVEGNSITVQSSFTTNYPKLGTFLTEIEKYPLQLRVSQLALSRRNRSLEVQISITGFVQEAR